MHDGSVLGFKDKERKEVVHSLNTSFPPFLEEFRALTWCRWNLEEMAQYKEAQKCISQLIYCTKEKVICKRFSWLQFDYAALLKPVHALSAPSIRQ